MLLTYRYRLYPLRPQLRELHCWTHELAFLWNYALEQRRMAREQDHRSISYLDQQRDLTRWRRFDTDGLGRLPVVVAQGALQRLDLAFRSFFRRVDSGNPPGFPRFRRQVTSFSFVPPIDPWRVGPNGTFRLAVPRLGYLPVRRHRPPPDGSVKFVTIVREADGWFVSLSYAIKDPPTPTDDQPPTRPIGVDLGIRHLATLSDGATVEPPRFLMRASRQLARAQRKLSRRKKDSTRWKRQRDRVLRCHLRVARQRRDFAHKVSHEWTERFDLVAMEALAAAELGRGPLAQPIHDAGWSQLRAMVEYKARKKSIRFVAVDARGTSQQCSVCERNPTQPLRLSDREFECSIGHRLDRDVNAARNILARGMRTLKVGRKPAEVTRGEIGPLRTGGGRRVYQGQHAGSTSREFASGKGETTEPPGGPPRSIGPER